MIVVRVELWPHGDKSRARCLGEAEIANTGRGTETSGDYAVRLLKWGAGRRTWKKGEVKRFPRLRLGPWDLLYRALGAIVADRNPGTPDPNDECPSCTPGDCPQTLPAIDEPPVPDLAPPSVRRISDAPVLFQ